jgi:HCOMODA/2-hydroxy-3-carboxy-muconic semialdehyde decarboxylase
LSDATEAALTVRLAARAMARFALAHAYGHVSVRLDSDWLLVSGPRPLGCIGAGEWGLRVPIRGPLPAGALQEVRVHQAIYQSRADVGGICRIQPRCVMALSSLARTPRVLHGLGTYFAPAIPLWHDPGLLRDDSRAAAVAEALGSGTAIVLRGNGAVVVGESLLRAACHAFFLEDAARLELALLPCADQALPYTDQQARDRAVSAGGLYERMWEYLTMGDPEAPGRVGA